jgi:protein-tyrosine phosphatase
MPLQLRRRQPNQTTNSESKVSPVTHPLFTRKSLAGPRLRRIGNVFSEPCEFLSLATIPRGLVSRFLGTLLLLARVAAGADAQPAHVRNFGQVNQTLFRGGMPSDEGFRELKALGVSLVIDLRENGTGRDLEKQTLDQLGIHYAHIPLARLAAPTLAEIEQALSLILRDPAAKIYVHCLRGKDRTGTVIACYRIQHDGWDNRRALEEAKEYGMSTLERAMQSFILHFTPFTLPSLAPPGN